MSERLYALYLLFPHLPSIKNRFTFILSLLFGKTCEVRLGSGLNFSTRSDDYVTILHLLSLKRFASVFRLVGNVVEVSFDGENIFRFSQKLTRKDKSLLYLLVDGLKDGAVFVEHDVDFKHDKLIKIKDDVIETSEGVKFHIEFMHPGAIVETFVRRIHESYSQDLKDKIVIDVGAASGDTPLYFASNGAVVYAFEMVKSNYDDMLKNLELNPNLVSRIKPFNIAVGSDSEVEYFEDSRGFIYTKGGATFLKNKYGNFGIKRKVQGMTVKSILEKFNINEVELLKTDCKGCEFFLTKDELVKSRRIKIEYYKQMKDQKIESIIDTLKEAGYKIIIYKHTPTDTTPISTHGNILAELHTAH